MLLQMLIQRFIISGGRDALINYTFVNCSSNQLLMFLVAKNGADFLTEIHLLPYLFSLAFLSFLYLYYSMTTSTVKYCAH